MLYGEKKFVKELLSDIERIEEKQGFKSVFGSTIGSISKGLQRENSDYDIRMLYVWKERALLEKEYHTEEKIRYREFYPSKKYDCIAFWEICGFLNFLSEPFINSGYKYSLVKNVLWSFFSDYRLDPYNIAPMVKEVLQKSVSIELERHFHQTLLENLEDKRANLERKSCLNMYHAYLSMRWIDEFGELPPLHINRLLSVANSQIEEQIRLLQSGIQTGEVPEMVFGVKKYEINTEDILKNMEKNKGLIRMVIEDVKKVLQ